MTKRRRERDRPKAAHDAPYNPNKRMLLSYESDEEDQSHLRDGTDAYSSSSSPTRSLPAMPDSEEAGPVGDIPGKHDPAEDAPQAKLEAKRTEDQSVTVKDDSLWSRPLRRNDTTGQWAALGSLSYQFEDGDEEEEYDSEEAEAMSYLQSVRVERQNLPTVFRAPHTFSQEEIYEDGLGDTRGYYEDGAYVASANLGPHLPEDGKVSIEPQEAFTNALKARFLKQRERIHTAQDSDSQSSEDRATLFPARDNKATAEWQRRLRAIGPVPSQIRAMEHSTVFRLLDLVEKHYLVRGRGIASKISAWIWALLARLDDVGSLNNDQVWRVRELGKKAVLVQLSFTDPAAAEQLAHTAAEENPATPPEVADDSAGDQPSMHKDEGGSTLVKDAISSKQVESLEVRRNTVATLDAIIVIVGDIFRQRDLLEFRQPWDISPEET